MELKLGKIYWFLRSKYPLFYNFFVYLQIDLFLWKKILGHIWLKSIDNNQTQVLV